MLKQTQTIVPELPNTVISISNDYCSQGDVLAVRAHNKVTKQDMLLIYTKTNVDLEITDYYAPEWWTSNWQVAIRGINDSIYFVAIDIVLGIGHVVRYRNRKFETVFTVNDCECTLGMNDKSIAISQDEQYIAVTNFRVRHNTEESTLLYSAEIILHDCKTETNTLLSTAESSEYNRIWSFRSLAIANNQVIAGSPDLTFITETTDTMHREYNGNGSKIDVFDFSGNHLTKITARDATPGNFFGTELEASGDGHTLIVMAPAQDQKIGCAYQYKFMDRAWVQAGKYSPRDIAIHTDIKYSLYGCCVNHDGSKFMLSDGLFGAIYVYNNNELLHTHHKKGSKDWFGFDIKTNDSFTQVAVIERDTSHENNSLGAVYLFEIS